MKRSHAIVRAFRLNGRDRFVESIETVSCDDQVHPRQPWLFKAVNRVYGKTPEDFDIQVWYEAPR